MTAGERWAAEELLALRAGGFRPTAWHRFVAASFQRSRDTRHARPLLARQARVWSTTGLSAGLAAGPAARRIGVPAPRPAAWTAWWLATAAMLDWHLGMLEAPDAPPRDRLRAADALTLARIGLTPFIATTRPCHRGGFIALLGTVGATDLLDGPLARRTGPTRLGRDLDTLADLLTRTAAVHAARRAGWVSRGAARLAVAHHALPLTVVSATYFRTGTRPPRGRLGETRWTGPALLAGLALSPATPRAGNALVRAASLLSLTVALSHQRDTSRKENHVVGPPRIRQRPHAAHPRVAQPQPRRPGRPPRALQDDHVRPVRADA